VTWFNRPSKTRKLATPSLPVVEPLQLQLNVPITLRAATSEDLPKLEWHGEYLHFRRVFAKAYDEQQQGRRLMLLACANDFPIGQLFVQLSNPDDIFASGRKRGYFYSLRVMDSFRNQGLGTALLNYAEHQLRERNYVAVSIAAALDNPGARRLYERLGFAVISEDSGHWHYVDHEGVTRYVHEPCWILEKQLTTT